MPLTKSPPRPCQPDPNTPQWQLWFYPFLIDGWELEFSLSVEKKRNCKQTLRIHVWCAYTYIYLKINQTKKKNIYIYICHTSISGGWKQVHQPHLHQPHFCWGRRSWIDGILPLYFSRTRNSYHLFLGTLSWTKISSDLIFGSWKNGDLQPSSWRKSRKASAYFGWFEDILSS